MKKNLTTILFALVAMMMPIGAWATAYETPDFSDAKVLTTVDGSIYVDGVELEITTASLGSSLHQTIPVGKYILNSNIESIYWLDVNEGEVMINLNGYTWNLNDRVITVTSTLSIYDTSANETGKISSDRNVIYLDDPEDGCLFNLYSGTLESRGATNWTLDASWGSAYLYGGTIKGNGPGVYYYLSQPTVIKLIGTVIDNGAGQPHCSGWLAVDMPAAAIVDVSEYEGDSLNVYIDVVNTPGKMTIIRGIQDAQEAARYTIDVVCESYSDLFCEKEEYDPTTGEKCIYITTNQFTQQPTLENGGTVAFNNPAATLQWYEVEHIILTDTNTKSPSEEAVYVDGYWKAQRGASLFEYNVKAGDILLVTTTADIELLVIDTGEDYIELRQNMKSSIMSFENDTYIRVWLPIIIPDTTTVDLQFTIIKETLLPDETGNTLQQATHGKTYYCKATVGEKAYVSDFYQYKDEALWGISADALTESGTLAEAIMAVRTDGAAYVQLQRDILGAGYMQVLRNDVTLDLNGYTVTAAEAYLFTILNVEGDVHMTVIDSSPAQSGEIIATKEGSTGAIFSVYGHLTIENGSFVGNDHMGIVFNQSDGTVSINGGYLRTEKNYTIDNQSTLQISGGVFESSDKQVLQLSDGSATISGGSFIASDNYESFRYYQGVLDLAAYPTEVEEGTTPLNELNFTYWGETTMSLSELDIRLPEGYYVLHNNQVVDTLNPIDIYYFGTGVTTDVAHTSTASPTPGSQKVLRDGQLIILRDGKEYNVMGQEL